MANGSICHVELYAASLDDSAAFYAKLFGWKTDPLDAGYMIWRDPAGMSGGFTTAGSPVTNPAATMYLRTEDIPGKLEEVVSAGGTIIRTKTEIAGDYGFYALFRDPAGNNMGLWSPAK